MRVFGITKELLKMNKNILIIIGLTFILPSLYAQRVCNLEGVILSPRNGDEILSPGPNIIETGVINHGPDTLYPTDYCHVGLWFQSRHFIPRTQQFRDTIYPKDTFRMTQSEPLYYKKDMQDIKLCINRLYAYTWHTIKTDTIIYKSWIDTLMACTFVDVKYTLNVQKLEDKTIDNLFFPNPAKEFIYLNSSIKNGAFTIHDLMGKIIISENTTSGKIDISTLKDGFYIVVLKTLNGNIHKSKLIKVQ